MKISLIMVTWNRLELTRKSCDRTLANAGDKIDQLIWIDNGSTDGTAEYAASLKPDVLVLNKENLGLPKAYNAGMALADTDALAFTCSDTWMPDNWLREMKDVLEADPSIDCVMMSGQPLEQLAKAYPNRVLGPPTVIGGRRCVPAIAFEVHLFRRSLLKRIGYFREEFGLYGWCDEEWFLRAHRHGAKSVMLIDSQYQHLGFTGFSQFHEGHGETAEYWKLKNQQASDREKIEFMNWCVKNDHPYSNPYA